MAFTELVHVQLTLSPQPESQSFKIDSIKSCGLLVEPSNDSIEMKAPLESIKRMPKVRAWKVLASNVHCRNNFSVLFTQPSMLSDKLAFLHNKIKLLNT